MSIIGRVGIRGKIALCAALFSIVWVVVVLLLHGDMRSDPQFALPMDHHKYLAMAQQDVGTFRIAPFCWRIGAPAIAHAIGGDPWMVMMVLTAHVQPFLRWGGLREHRCGRLQRLTCLRVDS